MIEDIKEILRNNRKRQLEKEQKMELSQPQKDLLNLLQKLKMNTEDIVLVMTACQEEQQIIQMINFLIDKYEEKQEVTQQEILNKILEMNQ